MMKTTNLISIAVFAAGAASLPAHATDIAAGAAKAKEVCAACHGQDGNSANAEYPRLAGQHRDYLAKALRDYKSGARKNAIMGGMTAALTRDDIDSVAAYYASLPPVVNAKY
jgi:cytochrome c553